jgi:hypothetical protein
MMTSKKIVTPAKAGVQYFSRELMFLDTGFRRYDESHAFLTFYEEVETGG